MPDRLDFAARLEALRAPSSSASASSASAPRSEPVPTVYTRSSQSGSGSGSGRNPELAHPGAPGPRPDAHVDGNMDMGAALGPAYAQAIATAQHAIECERQRHVQDAIASYIRAGEALIGLGRQQSTRALQDSLKAKALELLQRAEGLDAWVTQVKATHPGEAGLHEAFDQSRLQEDETLRTTQRKVASIRRRNEEMTTQLAVLMKARSRFMRGISDRRMKEAENKRTGGENPDPNPNPDGLEAESPRDRQKRAVVNELHEFIGLPKIDRLRVFKPLSADAARDRRLNQLEAELEDAREESERLRAEMKKMEDALEEAEAYSQRNSMREEKEKEEMAAELARIKEQLEMERQQSQSSLGTRSRTSSFDVDEGRAASKKGDEIEGTVYANRGSEAEGIVYENRDMMDRLRASLGACNLNESTVSSSQPPPQTALEKQISEDGGMWV